MRFSRSPSDVTFESLFGSTARLACALIALWIMALWSSLQWYLLAGSDPFGPVVDAAAATDATLFCAGVAWLFVARPRVGGRDGLVLAMVLLLVVSVAWITPGLVAPAHIPQPVRVLQMMVIAFGATVLQLLMAGLARSARASLHMAYHDPLTELPNRRNFAAQLDAEIAAAAGSGDTVSVLFIDLDRFKLVNDSLGHSAGDALLCAVSDRIRARVRADSLVARQSGDEFLVLLRSGDELEHAHAVRRLAQDIQAELERPFAVAGRPVSVGASVGYAAYPADADSGEHLIQHADRRMYEMKQSLRGGRVTSGDPLADLECASRLRVAIAAGELEVHYQPVVSLLDGVIRSCEALVRWRRDGRLIAPGEFLDVAERCGLMQALSREVLDQACRQVLAWDAAGLAVPVAVNMPSVMLHSDGYAEILDRLDHWGVPDGLIAVELTEDVADAAALEPHLVELAQRGIKLLIDDFGTGYSSLARLASLPMHALKIDRSFVAAMLDDERAAAIVETVIALAGSLDLEVIAEGVETERQAAALRRLGCSQAQGFLYGRPMEAAGLRELLQRPRRAA